MTWFAMWEAKNLMIQNQAQGIMKGSIVGFMGKTDVKQSGDYRMDTESQCYVKLIVRRLHKSKSGRTLDDGFMWLVEDVLTGKRYELNYRSVGSAATEMEVIAWASR